MARCREKNEKPLCWTPEPECETPEPECDSPEPELQDPGEYMFHMQCRISKLDIVLPNFPKHPEKSICQQTCLTVSFLEFPELILCDDKNEEQRKCCYNEDEPYFLCGKSILFSLSTKYLERYQHCFVDPDSFQLLFKIYEVDPCNRNARDKLLGCCEIPLGEKFAKMWKTASNGIMHEPPCFCVNDDYNFVDPAGHMKGRITAFVKMSCFGKTMVTQCHTGPSGRENLPSGLMKSPRGSPKCDKPLQIESYCQTDKQTSKIDPCTSGVDQGKRGSIDSDMEGIDDVNNPKLRDDNDYPETECGSVVPAGAEDAPQPTQRTNIDETNEQEYGYEEIQAKVNGHILYFQVLKPQKNKDKGKKYSPTSKAIMGPSKDKNHNQEYDKFKKSLGRKKGTSRSMPLQSTGIESGNGKTPAGMHISDPYSTMIDDSCVPGCGCNTPVRNPQQQPDVSYSPYFKDSIPYNYPPVPYVESPSGRFDRKKDSFATSTPVARRKLDFGENDRDSELCGIPRTPPTLVSPIRNDDSQECIHKKEDKAVAPDSRIKEIFSLNVGKKFTADGKARPKMLLRIMAPKTAEDLKAEKDAAEEDEEWARKLELKRKGKEFASKDTQVAPEDLADKDGAKAGKKDKGGKGKKGGKKKK